MCLELLTLVSLMSVGDEITLVWIGIVLSLGFLAFSPAPVFLIFVAEVKLGVAVPVAPTLALAVFGFILACPFKVEC